MPSQLASRRRPKLCSKRKEHLGNQHRLQWLLVHEWKVNKKQKLAGNGVGPSEKWLTWLESDWFVRVCEYVGPTGAYALCRLARTSRGVMQAMWHASEAKMRRYGMTDAAGQHVLPMYSVMGYKRTYTKRAQHALVHPVPKNFRIVAHSRMCRVCYGAQSASTHIKVKVGPHFASQGMTTVPVCEQCVLVHKAPTWTSVQVYVHRVSDNLGNALLRVVNMPTPVDNSISNRRTACGCPTVLLGPMCRAAGLRDTAYAQLAAQMHQTLVQARARRDNPEAARRALLDCAARWGGINATVRRCLR